MSTQMSGPAPASPEEIQLIKSSSVRLQRDFDVLSGGSDPASVSALLRRPRHPHPGVTAEHHRLVIVGGSDAGIAAGLRAHQHDPTLARTC